MQHACSTHALRTHALRTHCARTAHALRTHCCTSTSRHHQVGPGGGYYATIVYLGDDQTRALFTAVRSSAPRGSHSAACYPLPTALAAPRPRPDTCTPHAGGQQRALRRRACELAQPLLGRGGSGPPTRARVLRRGLARLRRAAGLPAARAERQSSREERKQGARPAVMRYLSDERERQRVAWGAWRGEGVCVLVFIKP